MRDVRAVLACGVIGIACAGALVRASTGPGPTHGAATNEALAREVNGDAAGAAAMFGRVAEASPNDAGAWLRYGRALREASQPEESREALARAAELEPGRAIFHYELAKTLVELGAVVEADAQLQLALKAKPRHADAWGLRAGIAASQGDVEHTLEWLALAEKLHHSNLDRLVEQRLFDPVRHDPRFAEAMRHRRVPDLERESSP